MLSTDNGDLEKNNMRITQLVNIEMITFPISNCFLKLVEYNQSNNMLNRLAKIKYQNMEVGSASTVKNKPNKLNTRCQKMAQRRLTVLFTITRSGLLI